MAALAPAAGEETEARQAGPLERALAEKARSYGQQLAASQDAASLAPMATEELRGYFEGLAGDQLRAALKDALPDYEGGHSQSADAFMSALAPRIEASVTEIAMAAVTDLRGGGAGQAGGAALSDSLERAQGDLLAALIESGAAAAQASGLPFTGNLEVEGTVSSDGKPEYRILTTQELWATDDIRHTVMAQASFSNRDDRETYNAGLAWRYLSAEEKHLYGVNAFFDYQMPYKHRRMSIGADYHNSMLDAHFNRYIALSGWQDARFGYEEQPLSGWDAELGGRPPFAQWLRVSARGFIWEQDRTPVLNPDGDDVTGQEYAFEITPMEALTWRAQITDESGRDPYLESTLRFNYRMGERAREQLRGQSDWSLESVADMRLTKVRRENRIIVQERQEPDFTAIVTNTVGANTALTQDGQSKSLSEGMAIAFGTNLSIANTAGAIADLRFGNGAVLRLAQDSRATIDTGQIAITAGTAQFISGGTVINLAAGGNDIALLGTDVDVRVAGNATTLRVRDGAANFRDASGVTRLAAGEIARAVDGDAVPPQKLAEADPAFSAHESETHERLNLAGEAFALPKAAPYVPQAVQVGGTYAAASEITFAVTFTKPVSVSGAPELAFTLGGAGRTAALSSGSGTQTLTFAYTVTGADPGSPDIGIDEIVLNGGAITGTDGKLAVLSVSAAPGGSLADSNAPVITALTAVSSGGDPANPGDVITVTLDANEDLLASGAPTLTLDIGGVTRTAAFSAMTSGNAEFTYTLQSGDVDSDGIAVTAINVAADELEDAAGNDLDTSFALPAVTALEVFAPTNLNGLVLWLDATDASTIAESSGSVSQWDDKSGNSNNAAQSSAAEKPVYDGSSEVTFDQSNDNLEITVPGGGFAGTIVMGFKQGSFAAEVSWPAGTHELGPDLADDELVGVALYDRTLSSAEKEAVLDWLAAKGAGTVDGWASVVSFFEAWFENNLTSFPALDLSSGTNFKRAWINNNLTSFPALDLSSGENFVRAWRGNDLTSFPAGIDLSSGTNFFDAWKANDLTSFPALNLSSGEKFRGAWFDNDLTSFPALNLSSGKNFFWAWKANDLTSFPANMFDSLSAPVNNCFDGAWDGNVIDAAGMENILTSIDTSGANAPASGVDITIDSNGDPLTAATTAAITSLKGKGWTITIDGVAQ